MTDQTFTASIGGTVMPFTKFSMTGGAFGTVGHVAITTTSAALQQVNLDLFTLTSGSPGFVEVSIAVQQTQQTQSQDGGYANTSGSQSSSTRFFGGEYIRTEFDLDADIITIHARDWAGVLVDQKRILTKIGLAVEKVLAPLAPGRVSAAGISNENQKISDIVTSICTEFGFKPVLNLSASGRNPTVGTLYGSADQSFITIPQSLWTVLNQLARDTGYDVYVTPTKELVFGEPGVGQDTLQLTYNVAPASGQLPCKHTTVEHHPRRNSTFRVLVMSYDPSLGQTTLGRATYVGANFGGQHGLSAGLSTGQAAVSADKNLAALKQSSSQVPLYSFNLDGLSADQATLKAQAIATDIAKRELILTTTIDGLPSVLPTQMIRLSGDVPPAFSEPTFYVSAYNQTFTLPEQHSHGNSGWSTRITALNIPTEGLAKGDEG